ncbi:uncharacterized protein LOC127797252 [Diospyros lotus]|uniref:uncharacterized protein LOC127797252 n=1 Tax=Diospyros lotus TaxID=55363 RepID=UPI002250E00C|nr:uncharacterized protein LOC127797252 [Diospyros lotus]
MGKKLDALLGRGFKANKFKSLVNLAVSRLAILKKIHRARCSISRSDVLQLLNLGQHDHALRRVEQVMREQNMLDVFDMVEGYCHLLVERISLIEQQACPEELKDAVSSLLYAATRCGNFPEIQKMRVIFTSRFGKEFAARAIELRDNCGVNPNMVEKLSTRQPSLENRVKLLKEIASTNNIVLQIEEEASSRVLTEENLDREQKQKHPELEHNSVENEARRKYKDFAEAAEEAFRSAAYAAAAVRVAVELSRSESQHHFD